MHAQKPATYADLLAVPEPWVAELLAGELHTSPRPGTSHAFAASVLGSDVVGRWHRGQGGPGGWWILIEPEVHLGEDVLVPDIAGWRRETLPALSAAAHQTRAPDWVCEVLSPRNALWDRARKLPAYASHGVGWAWLVDPAQRTVEVFDLRDRTCVLVQTVGGTDDVSLPPFEATPIALGELWLPGDGDGDGDGER